MKISPILTFLDFYSILLSGQLFNSNLLGLSLNQAGFLFKLFSS